MATKRGFCPYCHNKLKRNHYFDVNPEAKVCFCPHCMKQINPEEAIKAYSRHVEDLQKNADYVLFEEGNPSLAYQLYAEIIEFESHNTSAFLGRLLCLLFMSKVRQSYIKDVTVMLEAEVEQYHKSSEYAKYVETLLKMNNIVDQYNEILLKKLSVKSYFHDEECLRLYLKHFSDIIKFKEMLLKEANYVTRKSNESKAALLVNLLEIKIDEQTHALTDEAYVTVNGDHYRFEKIKRNGDVEIRKLEGKREDIKILHYHRYSLDPNAKKARLIKDVVFKDYTKILRANRNATWLSLTFYLLAAGAGVAVYFFFVNIYIFYPLIGGGALFLGLGTLFLILHIKWKKEFKKKKKMQIY